MEELIKSLPQDYALFWGISHLALILLLIKLVPKIIQIFEYSRKKVNDSEKLESQIMENTKDICVIKEQIGRDYKRLNELEKLIESQQDSINDSLQERELILKSLMRISQGLQELGANGPTKQAENEIQEFLIQRAHKRNN